MWEALLAGGSGKSAPVSSGGDFSSGHGGNVFSPVHGFEFSTQNLIIIGGVALCIILALRKGK